MLADKEALRFYQTYVGCFMSESLFASIAEFLIEFASTHEGNIDINQLLSFVEGSGMENASKIADAISALALQEGLPACTRKALEDLVFTIKDETAVLQDQMKAKRAIDSGSVEDGAAANAELARKIYEKKWAKRSGKGK